MKKNKNQFAKKNQMLISIIIPVYNDPKGLKKCLEAIQKQSYPLKKIEAIVVDNASETSPQDVVKSFSFAKYLYEKKPGSYAARNKGMSFAKGKYIVFLDADCIPQVDWLEKGIQCLEKTPDKILVGGDVKFISSKKPTATELYQSIVGFQQKENIEQKHFSATANLFVTKKDAEAIGLFEEQLLSGGDRNWCWRAKEKGMNIIFCPSAIIYTRPRRSLKKAIIQAKRVAGGRFDFQKLDISQQTQIQKDLQPHRGILDSIQWILTHTALSYSQCICVLGVASTIKIITILERLRLKMGAISERR